MGGGEYDDSSEVRVTPRPNDPNEDAAGGKAELFGTKGETSGCLTVCVEGPYGSYDEDNIEKDDKLLMERSRPSGDPMLFCGDAY